MYKIEDETSLCHWNDLFGFIESEASKSRKLVNSKLMLADYKKSIESKNYTAVLNQIINNERDLVTVMCIAYSWMPTMLDIHADDATLKEIVAKIKNLEYSEYGRSDELFLITELSKAANNSLVGAIKTLHLIKPDRFPLIDSRILIAWKKLINFDNGFLSIEPLVYSWNIGSKPENLQKLVLKYFYYRSFLLDWVSKLNNGVTIRDIEFRLYLMGDKN